jgi:hypothetical protein
MVDRELAAVRESDIRLRLVRDRLRAEVVGLEPN